MLKFKDVYEQHFWHTIITELWAGVSIAQEECDTTVLVKISRNIALMDALANIDINEVTNDKKSRPGYSQVCFLMKFKNDYFFVLGMCGSSFG